MNIVHLPDALPRFIATRADERLLDWIKDGGHQ